MASINDNNGVKSVQVYDPNGRRLTISLGRTDDATAATFAKWTQAIVDAQKHGQPIDGRAMKWLAGLSDRLHARVARAGLDAPRSSAAVPQAVPLGSLCDHYIGRRTDI